MPNEPRVTKQTRRQFLGVVGGATIGLTSTVAAQETSSGDNHQGMCCFALGGRVSGWQGRGPQSIAGQKNPTLQLEPGRTYGVMWQNLDGQPHTFALRDSSGKNLPVILPTVRTMQNGGPMMGGQNGTTMGGQDGHMMGRENGPMMGEHQNGGKPPKDAIKVTPQLAKKGAVQMLAFVATRDVKQYLCTTHPTTMVGQVRMTQQSGDSGNHSGEGNQGNTENHGHGDKSGNNGGS